MGQVNLYDEFAQLVTYHQEETPNYFLSSELIVSKSEQSPIARIRENVIFCAYHPLSSRRLVEIDTIMHVCNRKVVVAPSRIIQNEIFDDEEMMDAIWYSDFKQLYDYYHRKDGCKKKAYHHLKYLFQNYVSFFVHLHKRTPRKTAEFLNVFIDLDMMEDEIQSIDAAELIKRKHDFIEYDLPAWRQFRRTWLNNETGFEFLRYVPVDNTFETTTGWRIKFNELAKMWQQFQENAQSSLDIYHPLLQRSLKYEVALAPGGQLAIGGVLMEPKEVIEALKNFK